MRGFKDNKDNNKKDSTFSSAFTLIELIVVVAVIAILATIAIVGYSSWRQATATAQLKSDLNSVASAMENYRNFNNGYPTDINTLSTFKPSSGVTLSRGSTDGGVTYCVDAVNSQFPSLNYFISNSESAQLGTCTIITCPSGFISVPGSSTYSTNTFCVMKYEAKNVSGVATSQAALTPWVSISQTTAITTSVAVCSGCHLITENEWMTIAQNVLSVASNWDNGVGGHTVGTGYIYSGHNDNAPGNALVADPSDANGYAGTGNVAPSNQKRTLNLSNGEVIWDLAGNVWEWTSGTMTGGQPTGMASWNWYQWTAVSGGTFAVNSYPSGTGIGGSSSWDSTKGIGQIYGLTSDASLRGFLRGGTWYEGGHAGVFALNVGNAPGNSDADVGFRVSR